MLKKKWFLFSLVSIMLIAFGSYVFLQDKVTAEISSSSSFVPSFKNWTVNFSESMDPASFSSEAVQVLNENKEVIPVTFQWKKNHTSLHLLPPKDGYQIGEKYTLILSDKVTTARGEKLGNSLRHSFETVQQLPNIKNQEHLVTLLKERNEQEPTFFSTGEEKTEESASQDSAAPNTSQTNNQVNGVAEGDIVKTAGNYIYFARESDIVIAKAAKKESKIIATIEQKNFRPADLHIYQDRLVIIGHKEEIVKPPSGTESTSMPYPIASTQMAAYVYDISLKQEPQLLRDFAVEGWYVSSRRINEHVYFIANYHPPFHIMEEGKQSENKEIRPSYKDSLQHNGELTPVPYENIRYFPESNESQFLVLASLNLNQLEEKAVVESYLGTSENIYMSKNHLYTTVQQFEAVDNSMFSSEMVRPVYTDILQFDVEEGKVTYQASARVEGSLINQFAMDEREGSFRVATTVNQWGDSDNPSVNNLYTFDDNLNPLGSLEGLAEGERIYSVRFMQDRAYMVTFKQVDPLFVIDLKNPAEPEVLGQLKIPGFSNYLHPLDENHLLGFGQNTRLVKNKGAKEPIVRTDGLKLSVFDVSDVTDPKEKHTEIIGEGDSYSELNRNHKALYQHPEKNLFGFPVTLFDAKMIHKGDVSYQGQQLIYEGAFLYHITPESGITLMETFTHQQKQEKQEHPDWESQLRRLVSIGDTIYSFSYKRMGVYDLETKAELKLIDLPEIPSPYQPDYEPVEEPME